MGHKYKTLCGEIDVVLQAFDKTREWADLIKNLQRLNKVPCLPTACTAPPLMI